MADLAGEPRTLEAFLAAGALDEVEPVPGAGVALDDVTLLPPFSRPGRSFASASTTVPTPRSRARAAGDADLLREVRHQPCARRRDGTAAGLEPASGRRGRGRVRDRPALQDIPEADALDDVAGYTLLDDLSARDDQVKTPQWMPGKTFDGAAPFGPALVTKDEAGPHDGIEIALHLNGQRMQHSSTADLLHSIPALVAYLSMLMALEPGDAVANGTPGGVGSMRDPTRVAEGGGRGRPRLAAARLAGHSVGLSQALLGRPTAFED